MQQSGRQTNAAAVYAAPPPINTHSHQHSPHFIQALTGADALFVLKELSRDSSSTLLLAAITRIPELQQQFDRSVRPASACLCSFSLTMLQQHPDAHVTCSHKLNKAERKRKMNAAEGTQQQQQQRRRTFVLQDGASASDLSSELLFLREEMIAKQEEAEAKAAASAKQQQQQLLQSRDDAQVLYDEAMELLSECVWRHVVQSCALRADAALCVCELTRRCVCELTLRVFVADLITRRSQRRRSKVGSGLRSVKTT